MGGVDETMKAANILLADDDSELCEMLRQYLGEEGFSVDAVHDGQQALAAIRHGDYDLLILDVMMPVLDGLEVLRQLRHDSNLPVLMLTARGSDVDSIVGLELGADDYLPKPCNPRVLVARIRALLRRSELEAGASAVLVDPLVVADVSLHRQARQVQLDGRPLSLTSTEFRVLEALLADAGQVVDKDRLSREALGRPLTRYDRSLDMHISHLRRKLGVLPSGEERIETVRGVGYLYRVV